jgi:chromosomal replication initiation ATPase DnaA
MNAPLQTHGPAMVDPELLMTAYSAARNVPLETLISRDGQAHPITALRHELAWFLRQLTDLSFERIGQRMNRDYATVYAAHAKVAERIAQDQEYRAGLLALMTRVIQSIHAVDPAQPYTGAARHGH